MIILPLEFDFPEICPVSKCSQLCKREIFSLPDPIEAIVLTICVELYPVVALVPSHAMGLEIV